MASTHFQYEDKDAGQLLQGDILKRTPELESVLESLYPYAHQNPDKYPFFVVLTQSCDLVAEGKRDRKAEHLTLCAARPIHYFLGHEVSKLQTPVFKEAGICLTHKKEEFRRKVERLLSNEEYPYFYLHPTAETPFSEPYVAYLRITFPLLSDSHYEICLEAKRAQLAPEFRAKLGWLTTLVFGRVATKDFPSEDRTKHANEYIDSIKGVVWLRAKALQHEAKQKGLGDSLQKLSAEQYRELIAAVDVKSRPEAFADLVVRLAETIWPDSEEHLRKFKRCLLKDPDFNAGIGD